MLAAATLIPLAAADYWLYAREGFTRTFGEDTHDGQDLSKLRRARAFAGDADIIVFGGSYARFGISSKPFRDADILEWNFAVSGGGPVSSYFALKSIAPILASRRTKPVVLLEVFRDALVKVGPPGKGWSELVHLNGLARSRRELIADYGLLLPLASEYGSVHDLLVQTLLPSSVLRKYTEPLIANGNLAGYWYWADDDFGYAPIQDIAPGASVPRRPLTLEGTSPTKLNFLFAFFDLARSLGSPIVLLSSPQLEFLGDEVDRYDELHRMLATKYPELGFLPAREFGLTRDDFGADGWAHPNVHGADKISRAIIGRLGLKGTHDAFVQRYARLFDAVPLPPWSEWHGALVPTPQAGPSAFEYKTGAGGLVASFITSPIPSGMDALVELQLQRGRGQLDMCVEGTEGGIRYCVSDTMSSETRLSRTRIYGRFRSTGTGVKVTLISPVPSEGQVESVRVVADKAGRIGAASPITE